MEYLQLEKDKDMGVAVIWLDQPGEKLNKLSFAMAGRLLEILDEVEKDADMKGAVLISRKPDSFIAGADIEKFLEVKSTEEGAEQSRNANQLLWRLAQFPKPLVAAIHGVDVGGGLELVLACSYRIATDDPKTFLALPEVKLGLLPAAGGSQRLPRLIGISKALDMMLTGKSVYAKKAYKIGLVDDLIHPHGLLQAAKMAVGNLSRKPVTRKDKRTFTEKLLESNFLGRWLLFHVARNQVRKQSGGHYPAPFKILDAVKIGMGSGIKKGMTAEARFFGELLNGPIARELIQIFFNMTAHKKNPSPEEAKPVYKVGVLGAGLMGAGIASITAGSGIPVLVKDLREEALESAEKNIYEEFADKVKKGAITSFQRDVAMSRVFLQTDYHGFDNADIVIEAVFEDLELKRKVLAETEATIREDCVFASNTSCLPISDIAARASHPERVLGMHYFSPVAAMPLLEIITTPQTAPWALATAFALGLKQGKVVIAVADGPGFYTTRILNPYLNEAMLILDEGGDIASIDNAMKKFGFPVGPLALLDEVGLDVGVHVGKNMLELFAKRGGTPSYSLEKILAAGYKGRKNLKGFYRYEAKKGGRSKKLGINEEIYALLGGPKRKKIPPEDIQNRLTFLMINEAALCLEQGILKSPEDGDLGAVFGLGFPPFLGGPFRYINALTPAKVIATLEKLQAQYGPRFTAAGLLKTMR